MLERQPENSTVPWPVKATVFGVGVSVSNYEELTDVIVAAARRHQRACVTALAVHGLMTATNEPDYRAMLRQFEAVVPDGQPVRFALNTFCHSRLRERVRAVELTLFVCEQAAREHIKVYLYGSTARVVETLRTQLVDRLHGLEVVGCEPGIYRTLTSLEHAQLVDRISRSGAGLLLIGLGCPNQERFASGMREHLPLVQMCIGAAFEFLAGTKANAPLWMQRAGLEWLFRLWLEPRRLWKRYLVTNTQFIAMFATTLVRARLWGEARRRSPQRDRNS